MGCLASGDPPSRRGLDLEKGSAGFKGDVNICERSMMTVVLKPILGTPGLESD